MTGRALIGYTGFVGSHLARQGAFDAFYNSSNFRDMAGRSFDGIVCAGVSAVKWWANRNPDADWEAIRALRDVLAEVRTEGRPASFVLVSTVDVYPDPRSVDEESPIPQSDQAYGRHRRLFELFVAERFPGATLVRLPGLFGAGLKKNLIFDALEGRDLSGFHPDSTFQFYDLERLSADIAVVRDAGLATINLAVEPVSVASVLDVLGCAAGHEPPASGPLHYDMRTRYAALWGRDGAYLQTASECLDGIARFAAAWRAAPKVQQ